MEVPNTLNNRDGTLYVEGVSTSDLANRYGTPLYVYSEGRIRDNYRRLYRSLSSKYPKVKIHFAAKSNTNLSVLRILKEEGACLDTVSVGEVHLALEASFSPEDILFTGTNVRNEDLEYLLRSGVKMNVDSLSVLRRLLDIKTPEVLSVRVNPEIGAGHHEHVITAGKDSKFGIWEDQLISAYRYALERGVKRFGIHMHIGSGIMDPVPHSLATRKILEMAKRIQGELNIDLEFIDLGGGIGIPYRPGEDRVNLDQFFSDVVNTFREKLDEYGLGQPWLYMEPGRYIAGDAGLLLTRVNTLKETPHKHIVGVDAGFNALARPAMYGSYHHILLTNRMDAPEELKYDVTGPLCESGDFLTKGRTLPAVNEGDLLAVLDTGAYGFVMASNYNSTLKPPEVLVKGEEHVEIRAREGLEDLLLKQIVPEWLR